MNSRKTIAFYKCPIIVEPGWPTTNSGDGQAQGTNQRETTVIGAKVRATEDDSLARSQRGLNVFQATYLHQSRQRPTLPCQA